MSGLNKGQASALERIHKFLQKKDETFFLLYGPAGTGKTYCMQEFLKEAKGRLIFTAPTNKATKVLKSMLKTPEYTPECRTIYSLLGLRLEANGEIKELAEPEDPVDLSKYLAIVIDEASMINSILFTFIKRIALEQGLQIILLGDEFQIPPVGEPRSPIWDYCKLTAELTEVRRHGGVILDQVTSIREQINRAAPVFKRRPGQADGRGVWELSSKAFHMKLLELAESGVFSTPESTKAIAWRNVTVETLNRAIRGQIFTNASTEFWLPGDRLTLMEPANGFDDDKLGTTDDEGLVNNVEVVRHPLFGEFHCWRLSMTMDDNRVVAFYTLHPSSALDFQRKIEDLSNAARADRRRWRDFWEFKETFHSVRHGYATTAHRSQGSTYDTAFVDWRDILLNRTRREAFQCLYVASSRPRTNLYFN